MTRRMLPVATAALLLVWIVATSCIPPAPRHLQELGNVMDAMAEREAEFGTMTISAPILSDPNAVFKFDVNQTPEDFYNDARNDVQGRVSEFQQIVNSSGLGANISIDPSLAAGYLAQLQQYQAAVAQNAAASKVIANQQSLINSAAKDSFTQALSDAQKITDPAQRQTAINTAISNFQAQTKSTPGPATLPAFPTLPSPATAPSDLVAPPKDQTAQFANALKGDKVFAAFQSISGNQSVLSVDARTALVKAAGDTAVNAMFQVLGDPKLTQEFHNKRVLFGVSTIAVNPGWRTKKGYAANLAMNCTYEWGKARGSIIEKFIHDPRIPAPVRIRIALDQDAPLPGDAGVLRFLKTLSPVYFSDAQIELWKSGKEPFSLSEGQLKDLATNTSTIHVPPEYSWDDELNNAGILVAAVSPMTDIQTLDLESSYRHEQEIALKIALLLQLTGAKGQADAFLNYANNLQQDVSTLTPAVFANSYSTGPMFGFQIGPQLRAIESVKRGQASQASQILERQSFPALIAYGFDAADVLPRVKPDPKTGKLQLVEPALVMTSAHSWVPIDRTQPTPILRDSERLQLSYWKNRYLEEAASSAPVGTITMATNRIEAESHLLFGSAINFGLPDEVVFPTLTPAVTRIEPAEIRLDAVHASTVNVAMDGVNLDVVDLNKVAVVSGGVVVHDSAKLVGGTIALQVEIPASENPPPLVISLPSYFGGGTSTRAIIPYSGSLPSVTAISPQVVSLDADVSGNITPANVEVVIVGEHLDLIALDGVWPIDQTGVSRGLPELRTRNAIIIPVQITSAIQSIAFKLPQKGFADRAIFTPPIFVARNKMTVKIDMGAAARDDSRTRTSGDSKQAAAVKAKQDAANVAAGRAQIAQEAAAKADADSKSAAQEAAIVDAWLPTAKAASDAARKALAPKPEDQQLKAAAADADAKLSALQDMAKNLHAKADDAKKTATAADTDYKAAQSRAALAAAAVPKAPPAAGPGSTSGHSQSDSTTSSKIEYSPGVPEAIVAAALSATTKPATAPSTPPKAAAQAPTTQASINAASGSIIAVVNQAVPATQPAK